MTETISSEYRAMQQEMHRNPNYGVASLSFAPIVAELVKHSAIRSISDYGAGKCNLRRGLGECGLRDIEYLPYDPAFPEYGLPMPADLVCCIDVLEHVEEEHLGNVLAELARITHRLGFFSVHMGPAGKTLPDGRNAHLIQKPSSWWLPKLSAHFDVLHLETHDMMGRGFWVIVEPKKSF